ncbi:MAG: isoprenylcysteine carboxylmethyltransferase family protein [archaeon]|nr:isoprenylcysteine carboxylmethyltransferase family protein [archaeon]
MSENNNSSKEKVKLTKGGIRTATDGIRWTIIECIIFFIAAWRIDINEAWLFYITSLLFALASAIIFWKFFPEIANVRGKIHEGTKSWDLKVIIPYFLFAIIIIPIVAGIDIGRFQNSSSNIIFSAFGIIFFIILEILAYWAIFSNKFFEGTARIQEDRNHTVISTGPYSIIRHPGYFSMVFVNISFAFTICSFNTLLVSIIPAILIIIRTALEDKMLRDELDGYLDYTKKVKYRLFPFIW